jgi:hypothetical protein
MKNPVIHERIRDIGYWTLMAALIYFALNVLL